MFGQMYTLLSPPSPPKYNASPQKVPRTPLRLTSEIHSPTLGLMEATTGLVFCHNRLISAVLGFHRRGILQKVLFCAQLLSLILVSQGHPLKRPFIESMLIKIVCHAVIDISRLRSRTEQSPDLTSSSGGSLGPEKIMPFKISLEGTGQPGNDPGTTGSSLGKNYYIPCCLSYAEINDRWIKYINIKSIGAPRGSVC